MSGRLVALALVLHEFAAIPALAQSASDRIWDRAIMAQPFDERPLRQIKIPGWVEETIGCGYTLSGMDARARARAVKHGVTISELGFVDPFYAYYDSKLLARRSPHVPLDRLANDIAEYKRLGVRILAVYPPSLQGEVYEKHPEWRHIATNTTTADIRIADPMSRSVVGSRFRIASLTGMPTLTDRPRSSVTTDCM